MGRPAWLSGDSGRRRSVFRARERDLDDSVGGDGCWARSAVSGIATSVACGRVGRYWCRDPPRDWDSLAVRWLPSQRLLLRNRVAALKIRASRLADRDWSVYFAPVSGRRGEVRSKETASAHLASGHRVRLADLSVGDSETGHFQIAQRVREWKRTGKSPVECRNNTGFRSHDS